jgi:malonyl CoA-acyl carrier protein transacylase
VTKPTAVLFCPGRGSYGRDELGFIGRYRRPGPVADALSSADAAREAGDTITEIDGAERFRPSTHLLGVNAAELIYFSTMFHLAELRQRYDVVAIAGNSLGWYTALAAGGALDPTEGWRLVRSMALLQGDVSGGQVLTTTLDEDWREDASSRDELETAIEAVNAHGNGHFVATSIHLGGHEVVGGSDAGIAALLKILDKRQIGDREFPFQLAGTGPFHTSLCESTAQAAKDKLADLRIGMPDTHLIDGRGNIHSPWSSSPHELLDYTLTTQVTTTFDFTASVRAGIREFNPDTLLCAGPGTSLRAPVGHVALAEGYHGIGTRGELFESELVAID